MAGFGMIEVHIRKANPHMTPTLDPKNRAILIVAAENWLDRISLRLSLSGQAPDHCDNVFQAIAGAAENQKEGVASIILILIDSLEKQEMDVFETLSQLSLITTWAISSLDQPGQKKFQLALANGAAGCAVLNDHCPELARLIETLRQEPNSIEQPRPVVIPKNQQAVQVRQPVPPVKAEETVDEDDEMDLLSDEELEALLGPSHADE